MKHTDILSRSHTFQESVSSAKSADMKGILLAGGTGSRL